MASYRAENSSDLERARDVSRRLRPAGSAVVAPALAAGTAPARPGFSAERARMFVGALSERASERAAVPPAARPGPTPTPPAPVPAPAPPAFATAPRIREIDPTPRPSLPRTGPVAPSLAAAASLTPAPPSGRATLPSPPAGGSWENLLAWCRTGLAADAAFVIDRRGLLVANSGKLGDDEAQAMGARLVVAMDQADALDPGSPVRTLALDLSTHCLTAIRLQIERGPLLTVGVLSLRPLSASAGALVRKAFLSKLGER